MNLIEKMSNDLNIDQEFITKIAGNSKKYYSHYSIKKKNGGTRLIYHPSPCLKTFQYWLVYNVFNYFKISRYAFAYDKGCSIKKNASAHLNGNYILHIDIRNFFESINSVHILDLLTKNSKTLMDLSIAENDYKLILDLCLYNDHLVIGSVCAPRLSNCVMYDFDEEVDNLITNFGDIIYTRYADDIVLSSREFINNNIINELKRILLKYRFDINLDKTKFMSNKGRKIVTGLIINNGKLSIGMNKRLELKEMLYKKLKYNQGDGNKILGHLFFLKDIEPQFFNKLILKYSKYGDVLEILKRDQQIPPIPPNINRTIKEAAITSDTNVNVDDKMNKNGE
jgi:hypothetical protein